MEREIGDLVYKYLPDDLVSILRQRLEQADEMEAIIKDAVDSVIKLRDRNVLYEQQVNIFTEKINRFIASRN